MQKWKSKMQKVRGSRGSSTKIRISLEISKLHLIQHQYLCKQQNNNINIHIVLSIKNDRRNSGGTTKGNQEKTDRIIDIIDIRDIIDIMDLVDIMDLIDIMGLKDIICLIHIMDLIVIMDLINIMDQKNIMDLIDR